LAAAFFLRAGAFFLAAAFFLRAGAFFLATDLFAGRFFATALRAAAFLAADFLGAAFFAAVRFAARLALGIKISSDFFAVYNGRSTSLSQPFVFQMLLTLLSHLARIQLERSAFSFRRLIVVLNSRVLIVLQNFFSKPETRINVQLTPTNI